MCLRFGPFDCDRFASDSTALLPRFNAMFWSADCWFVDCFARSWSGYSNWCHPNPRDAGRVLEKVRKERVKAALLVPEWCGAVWWRQLCPDGRHLGPWVIDWLVLPKYCFNRGQGSGLWNTDWPRTRLLVVQLDGNSVVVSSKARSYCLDSPVSASDSGFVCDCNE